LARHSMPKPLVVAAEAVAVEVVTGSVAVL
jgi:hypothetical protein